MANTSDKEDVNNLLMEREVIYGIDKKLIEEAIQTRQENIPFLVANGDAVVHGQDAVYDYKVDLSKKYNMDGDATDRSKLDFTSFRNIISVK